MEDDDWGFDDISNLTEEEREKLLNNNPVKNRLNDLLDPEKNALKNILDFFDKNTNKKRIDKDELFRIALRNNSNLKVIHFKEITEHILGFNNNNKFFQINWQIINKIKKKL